MTRTFWLSFSIDGKNAGVCVVDVTDVDVDEAQRPARATDAAWENPEVRWLAAAIQASWERGCNPGGSVGSMELPTEYPVPRNRLLVGKELETWSQKRSVH